MHVCGGGGGCVRVCEREGGAHTMRWRAAGRDGLRCRLVSRRALCATPALPRPWSHGHPTLAGALTGSSTASRVGWRSARRGPTPAQRSAACQGGPGLATRQAPEAWPEGISRCAPALWRSYKLLVAAAWSPQRNKLTHSGFNLCCKELNNDMREGGGILHAWEGAREPGGGGATSTHLELDVFVGHRLNIEANGCEAHRVRGGSGKT